MISRFLSAAVLTFTLFFGCLDETVPADEDATIDNTDNAGLTGETANLICPTAVKGGPVSLLPECPICGNDVCESQYGESSSNCPADCGPSSYCGDGVCNSGESAASCMTDCHCGNGVCDSGWGETSSTCPGDCGTGGGGCIRYPCE